MITLTRIAIVYFAFFAATSAYGKAKPSRQNSLTKRSPSQTTSSEEIDLANTPHNCRIIIYLKFKSGEEKYEIYPLNVASEKNCEQTANLHKEAIDPRVALKQVSFLWFK